MDLFSFAKNCDLDGIKNFLSEHPKYDINTKDHRGVTALHLAVKFNCVEIVRFLLAQPKIMIGDTALLAIAENNLELTELLLSGINKVNPLAEFKGVEGSSAYPPYMTPLMLASLYGHYQLIKLLLKRRHTLPKPHDIHCNCSECNTLLKEDKLVEVDRRVALFKALCNPAYICLTSKDPILTSFQLFRDLQKWIDLDTSTANEYIEISKSISRFSSDFIAETNNSREVTIILKRKEGWPYNLQTGYPRLVMAMFYQNKEFVGNIHVQQVLENVWYGDEYRIKFCSSFQKLLIVIKRIFYIPILAVASVIIPHNLWVQRQLQTPVLLFIDRTIMFAIFLIVILWENSIDRKSMDRGFPNTRAEPFLILFAFGYLWRTFRSMMFQGIPRYFRFYWNIWDFTMQLFLLSTIICWIIAFFTYNIGSGKRSEPRKNWPSTEPILIAESALVFATIMAFIRILFLLQLHPILGPLQVSLSSMLKDCFKFLIIASVIMLAFSAGLNNLYHYYENMKYTDPETKEESKQEDSFMGFFSSLRTLYWSMFGLSEKSSGLVVIDNGSEHLITQFTGYILFLIFGFIMIIIVINMLIAGLSNAYQRVVDNSLDEWAYGKTEVYLAHMDGILVLPVPFNLLLEWINDIRQFVINVRDKKKKWHCSLLHGCFMSDRNIIESNEAEYSFLMTQLRSRYFLKNCKLFRLGVPEIADDFCPDEDDELMRRFGLAERKLSDKIS